MFTNKRREGINTFFMSLFYVLYLAKTPQASIKDHELALPILPFGIVQKSCIQAIDRFHVTSSLSKIQN